uniref:Uncharacterized protein n=1 Tax=Desertifilum tharense IPPAS B-1220 TaxID=1781255 RepID=A0ACD5GY26_9CYAN
MSQQGFCKRKGVGSWELGVGGRGWGVGRWGDGGKKAYFLVTLNFLLCTLLPT